MLSDRAEGEEFVRRNSEVGYAPVRRCLNFIHSRFPTLVLQDKDTHES